MAHDTGRIRFYCVSADGIAKPNSITAVRHKSNVPCGGKHGNINGEHFHVGARGHKSLSLKQPKSRQNFFSNLFRMSVEGLQTRGVTHYTVSSAPVVH